MNIRYADFSVPECYVASSVLSWLIFCNVAITSKDDFPKKQGLFVLAIFNANPVPVDIAFVPVHELVPIHIVTKNLKET